MREPGVSKGRPNTPVQLSAHSGVHMAAAHHTKTLTHSATVQLGPRPKQ